MANGRVAKLVDATDFSEIGNATKYKCEKCGLSEWQGEPLICELHHINGDSTDNRIENLIILCPNCHSQTDNFRSKNRKG